MEGVQAVLDANPVNGPMREGSRRFWTTRELQVLRDTYPTQGLEACVEALPGRTAKAIYGKCGALKLFAPQERRGGPRNPRYSDNTAVDATLRRVYPTCASSAELSRLAQAVMRPRWWVHKRAQRLGLITSRFKPLPWSAGENEIIRERATQHPATIAKALEKAGFTRSQTAIVTQLKRLGASRVDDNPDLLSARGLGELMGVDGGTVSGWIAKGMLRARKVEKGVSGDWGIHVRDVRTFVIENTAHVDLRKVDRFWFVDMLGGSARRNGLESPL